eukprot:gene18095-biopygen15953
MGPHMVETIYFCHDSVPTLKTEEPPQSEVCPRFAPSAAARPPNRSCHPKQTLWTRSRCRCRPRGQHLRARARGGIIPRAPAEGAPKSRPRQQPAPSPAQTRTPLLLLGSGGSLYPGGVPGDWGFHSALGPPKARPGPLQAQSGPPYVRTMRKIDPHSMATE